MTTTVTVQKATTSPLLTAAAMTFINELVTRFEPRRQALLAARVARQQAFDAGKQPDFDADTAAIRTGNWHIAPPPNEIADRRVEITGPTDRKTVINALNSGANVFMADLEDAHCPTWHNTISGQQNLYDAVRRSIDFTDENSGKRYALHQRTAVLMVRPRGWHLDEKHVHWQGKPISGALFDFGLYFFHNAAELLQRGSRPYFYFPKLEHHSEAALWADILAYSEQQLGLTADTTKVTVLIETLPAAFCMDEIIHALSPYIVGLNCGRWDYIFSVIKTFHNRDDCILPDRHTVTMTTPFLRAYSRLLIDTCHKRGVHAMGGMAAQIPIKHDAAKNAAALEKVRQDKLREAKDGHDGTWVAHPGLIATARSIFDDYMPNAHQKSHYTGVPVTAADLLALPAAHTITAEGVIENVRAALRYIAAWLGGNGCVPINFLMEDAATAEISRAQLWQWLHHQQATMSGDAITRGYIEAIVVNETAALAADIAAGEHVPVPHEQAADVLRELVYNQTFCPFLTLKTYPLID